MFRDYTLTNGDRVVYAPYHSNTTAVQSVVLKPDEKVEWFTRCDLTGIYVIGYMVQKIKDENGTD